MAKDKEDNRDIFEKALDYAVPVAGAYLGMKAGSRIASGGKRAEKAMRANQAKNRAASAKAVKDGDGQAAIDADRRARYDSDDLERHYRGRIVGGGAGGLAGGIASHNIQQNEKKRRK